MRDLVAPLFRCKRLLMFVFLSVFAAAASLGLIYFHKYEAHMTILVSRERLDPVVTGETVNQMDGPPALTDREVNSDAELLTAGDLLQQVVLSNNLQNVQGGRFLSFFRSRQPQAVRVARAVQSLAGQIQVETPSRTNLIKVTYRSPDPVLAYGVLNSLGNLYLEKHAAIHRPPGSDQFLNQEAQRYKAALEDAQAALRAFGETQGVARSKNEGTDLAQQLTAAAGQSHIIEQAIAADELRIQSDQEQMNVTPQSRSSEDTLAADLLLQNLGESLLAAETMRSQLLLKHEASDPLVKQADEKVADAKAAIAEAKHNADVPRPTDRVPTFESLRDDLAKDQADLETQRASLAAKQRGIESMRSQMAKPGSHSVDEADLEREAQAREQSYSLYLSQREREHASGGLDRTRTESVAIAVPPAVPVRPAHSAALISVMAFAVALLISLSMAYIVDNFDPSFHTPAEVIDLLGIPVVVAVPKRTA